LTDFVLLDLCCGAGGVATGYHRAGFRVVGVDNRPQKHYPFQFIQADALEYLAECGHCFDAIHASPPCQQDTVLASLHRAKGPSYDEKHQSITGPMRELLIASGKLYVIEGVVGAPLINPILLCGTMFGLGTECGAELQRHRLFETNWFLMAPPRCYHPKGGRVIGVYGHDAPQEGRRTISVHGRPQMIEGKRRVITVTGSTPQQNVERNLIRKTYPVAAARQAMGIDWMTQAELSQAIPPAYTEFIGRQLIELLRQDRA
jgi:DNA (cytosine-5)-methyltransferase 1